MKEYIEREAVLEEINEKISNIAFSSPYQDEVGIMASGMARIRDSVEDAPAADVVPVVHGRWIVTKEYNDVIEMDVVKYACSACGEYRLSATTLSQATNYCPNCGAKMKDGDGNG